MKKAILLLVLVTGTFGCNYNHVKESSPAGGRTGANTQQKLGNLDFMTVQMAVIGPRCLGCHSDATGNKGGANLESYQNVRKLLSRISFRSFEKMDMPPASPLSSEESLLLRTWLEMGAPEINLESASPSDPALEQGPTDWLKISEKIFAAKCLDCHSQPEPQAGLDLSNYEQTTAQITVIFDRVVVKQDMPVEPYPALSMKERKVLLNWINSGMPR